MKVLGKKHLEEFSRHHANVRSQLSAWFHEVEEAQWRKPMDIKARYPHASILSGNRVIFNIKGNDYRIDTKISYKLQIVTIKRIGTHAEYDKWKF